MAKIVLFPHNHFTASNTILQHLARSPFGARYPDAVALELDPDRLVRKLQPFMTAGGFAWPFGPIPLGDRSETWCVDEGAVDVRERKVGVPADPYATQMLRTMVQTHILLRRMIGGDDDDDAMLAGALLAYQGNVPLYCIDATTPEMALALLTLAPMERRTLATETLDELKKVEACARRGNSVEQAMWKAHFDRFGYGAADFTPMPATDPDGARTPIEKAFLHWRDDLMARRLARIAQYHRPDDTILAIVGAAHAFGMQERLQLLGLPAEIFWSLDA